MTSEASRAAHHGPPWSGRRPSVRWMTSLATPGPQVSLIGHNITSSVPCRACVRLSGVMPLSQSSSSLAVPCSRLCRPPRGPTWSARQEPADGGPELPHLVPVAASRSASARQRHTRDHRGRQPQHRGRGASSSVDQPNPPTARLPSAGRRPTVGRTASDPPSVEHGEVGVSTGFTMLGRLPR